MGTGFKLTPGEQPGKRVGHPDDNTVFPGLEPFGPGRPLVRRPCSRPKGAAIDGHLDNIGNVLQFLLEREDELLGLGRLGPAPPWVVVAEGVFDWLLLTGWGLPSCSALGTQGVERIASALRGCPRVFLAFDNDDAGREATERLLTLLGRRAAAVVLPEGVGDVGELAALPQGRALFLRLLSQAALSAR